MERSSRQFEERRLGDTRKLFHAQLHKRGQVRVDETNNLTLVDQSRKNFETILQIQPTWLQMHEPLFAFKYYV